MKKAVCTLIILLTASVCHATDGTFTRAVPTPGNNITSDMQEMRENNDFIWYQWIMAEVTPHGGVVYTASYNVDGTLHTQIVTGTPFTSPDPICTYTYNIDGTLHAEVWVINGITWTWTYAYSSGKFASKTLTKS